MAVAADNKESSCGPESITESAVRATNASFEAAMRASDADVLARLLAPDYLYITSGGETRDRQELLRSYGAREVRLRVFNSDSIRVRLYGTVGVLTAGITKEGHYVAGPRAGTVVTGRYRFTRLYACRETGWQLVSSHESRLDI